MLTGVCIPMGFSCNDSASCNVRCFSGDSNVLKFQSGKSEIDELRSCKWVEEIVSVVLLKKVCFSHDIIKRYVLAMIL